MKNNIENIFREKLQNYEEPYSPKAWDAVRSQLNNGAKSGWGSNIKWIVAGISIAAVGIGAFFFTQHNPQERLIVPQQLTQKTNHKIIQQDMNTRPATEIADKAIIETGDKITNIDKEVVQPVVKHHKEAVSYSKEEINESANANNGINKSHLLPENNIVTPIENPDVQQINYVAGNISSVAICAGNSVIISNHGTDKNSRVIARINQKTITLNAGEYFDFIPQITTNIEYLNDKNEVINSQAVHVQNLPSVDFSYEANIYEEGLPITICKAYGDFTNYIWSFDEQTIEGEEKHLVKYSFFNNGNHQVNLKVIDKNGCENNISKSIQIVEKYNLMAVDAFRPGDADTRNRTFMPYALTQRNTPFQLTIIDPVNSEVVFTSSNHENAWDGTDQKTGRMTPANKSYVWKVQLFSPLANERPVYTGTVVHQ